MKTLNVAYRVSDLDTSLAFYHALGYRELLRVQADPETLLVMLAFPGEKVVGLELVHRPGDGPVELGTGFHHLVVQVHDLQAAVVGLARAGLEPEPIQPFDDPGGGGTSWVTDPDGYRIELVEWPRGHADGISVDDLG